jgi:hypothetical protein
VIETKKEYRCVILILFSLICTSGCTNHQPKYEVGDIITNSAGGQCYGLLIVGHHWGDDTYLIQNVTRCNASDTTRWYYVGDNPRRQPFLDTDLNPLVTKIDHTDSVNDIPGPYRTIH